MKKKNLTIVVHELLMAVVGVEPSDVRLVLPADEISNPSIMKKKREKKGEKAWGNQKDGGRGGRAHCLRSSLWKIEDLREPKDAMAGVGRRSFSRKCCLAVWFGLFRLVFKLILNRVKCFFYNNSKQIINFFFFKKKKNHFNKLINIYNYKLFDSY